MYSTLPGQIGVAIVVVTALFALWKGDTAARLAGSINLLGQIAYTPARLVAGNSADVLVLVVDGLWALGLLFLAVRYGSLWLGAAMLIQAVQFSLHGYYLVSELRRDVTYAWVNNTDNWGICLCIIVGTILAWRRRVRQRREEAERQRSVGADGL